MTMLLAAALVTANFGEETGKIRPALHSSGFGPTICSFSEQAKADVKAMGFAYARTHDWALINPNERVCDYFHIFPLMHLDATDPKNYVFGPTDYLLKRTREEMGLDVFFRLGTSIEHSGKKVHFNTLVPEDFGKMAEIFAATVRHYNRGWADGHKWNIKYWEVWNEPDGTDNMWERASGSEGLSGPELEAYRDGLRADYVRFFVTVLKRLKAEFGDEIKVGGPALCTLNEVWVRDILAGCREAGVAPDFISWHGYRSDPMQFNRDAEKARRLCAEYGFPKCELIVNEWHYFGENYGWNELRHSDPKVVARVWDGPDGHCSIRSAAFTLATLANLQRSELDQAYFYGCRHSGTWGFKDAHEKKFKVFYALKLFGDLVRDYSDICASTSEGTVTTLAVKNAAGRKGLLVVDYGGTDRQIRVKVCGVASGAKASCVVLDNLNDLAPGKADFKDGELKLVKSDYFSAAYFVTFE